MSRARQALRLPLTALGRLRDLLAGVAVGVRDGARDESRRRRRLWIALAALLVLLPLAFNLARAPDFKASVQLFPRAVGQYPPVFDLAYYRKLLNDPILRGEMLQNTGGPDVARYEDVTIRRASRRMLVLTVAADKPANAQRFVNALAPQIAAATQRQLAGLLERERIAVEARLRERQSGARAAQERRRLRRLQRLLQEDGFPPGRVLFGAPAPLPKIERAADRIVDDLPGELRARPHPALAALAGLLVALTLWATALVLVPPARREPYAGESPQPS